MENNDRNSERLATMKKNVVVNADSQATPECRENYLRSCEAHGGEMIQIVAEYRLTHDCHHPDDCFVFVNNI